MFEEQLRSIPVQSPRSLALLPGLGYRPLLSGGWFILLVPVLMLAVFSSILTSDPATRLQYGHTAVAQGRVIAATQSGSCQNQGRRLSYAFTPGGGAEYRNSVSVCANSPYYSASVGDSVPVEYLPGNPAVNDIAGRSRQGPPVFVFLFVPLMFVLMFGGLFLPQLRELARAREAFRHGVLARGSVVYIRKRANTNWSNVQRAPYYDVYVAFQTQEGTRRESRAWCANEWLMLHLPPGAAVQLAYLPKRPEQIVLLEAFLR